MGENKIALIKKDTVDVVAKKVREFQERGELHLPPNYSPENAMKSAWLILQSTTDKNGKPVLQSCTRDSIANSLLDMIVQGLNPAKKQCYFIAYGDRLVCQRSYFGSMAVVKNVAGAKDIYAQVVYRGDEFEYEIKGARKQIIKHVQKIENVNKDNIIAAYCVIEFDDRPPYVEIMTMDQIKKAWSKSKMNPEKEGSTHREFTEEMAKKTVINRACKGYINSSNDANLLLQRHFNRTEETLAEAEVNEEIAENANGEYIDVEYEVSEPEETSQEEEKPRGNNQPEQGKVKVEQMSFSGKGPGF